MSIVGIAGLGRMGAAMAERLLKVHDAASAAGWGARDATVLPAWWPRQGKAAEAG